MGVMASVYVGAAPPALVEHLLSAVAPPAAAVRAALAALTANARAPGPAVDREERPAQSLEVARKRLALAQLLSGRLAVAALGGRAVETDVVEQVALRVCGAAWPFSVLRAGRLRCRAAQYMQRSAQRCLR